MCVCSRISNYSKAVLDLVLNRFFRKLLKWMKVGFSKNSFFWIFTDGVWKAYRALQSEKTETKEEVIFDVARRGWDKATPKCNYYFFLYPWPGWPHRSFQEMICESWQVSVLRCSLILYQAFYSFFIRVSSYFRMPVITWHCYWAEEFLLNMKNICQTTP